MKKYFLFQFLILTTLAYSETTQDYLNQIRMASLVSKSEPTRAYENVKGYIELMEQNKASSEELSEAYFIKSAIAIQMNKVDESKAALKKSHELNPNYEPTIQAMKKMKIETSK